MTKHNPMARLYETFDLSGITIHRPKQGLFGSPVLGTLSSNSDLTGTGMQLLQSILLAEQHVAEWQAAITNMRRVLEEAESVQQGEQT
jgi:hypothetical protein